MMRGMLYCRGRVWLNYPACIHPSHNDRWTLCLWNYHRKHRTIRIYINLDGAQWSNQYMRKGLRKDNRKRIYCLQQKQEAGIWFWYQPYLAHIMNIWSSKEVLNIPTTIIRDSPLASYLGNNYIWIIIRKNNTFKRYQACFLNAIRWVWIVGRKIKSKISNLWITDKW